MKSNRVYKPHLICPLCHVPKYTLIDTTYFPVLQGHGVHGSHSKIILEAMRLLEGFEQENHICFLFYKVLLATVQSCLYERLEWKPGNPQSRPEMMVAWMVVIEVARRGQARDTFWRHN